VDPLLILSTGRAPTIPIPHNLKKYSKENFENFFFKKKSSIKNV
jgi:hypothetical protein